MACERKLLILGAGPTGLGAALRLVELGQENWLLCERNDNPGGLSASFTDRVGFTWDIGGHIFFSQHADFNSIFEDLTSGEYFTHDRKTYINLAGRLIPYPFQNNIRYLPEPLRTECLDGLEKASNTPTDRTNFLTWCKSHFGEAITRCFMQPDNEKRWAVPIERLGVNWIADRVSPVDFERVRDNVLNERDDVGWGLNNRFRFPRKGGTGSLFNRIAGIAEPHIRFRREAISIDPLSRSVEFNDGTRESYDSLLTTIPLDHLFEIIKGVPAGLLERARSLEHNNAFIVGIGIQGECPSDKCWLYYPEGDTPFYRVTYFSNYSPFNAPDAHHYSLMCDITHSSHIPRDKATIVDDTIAGLIRAGLLREADRDRIVSRYLIDAPYAYPIPTVERDDILSELHAFLHPFDIASRGRFGAWLYEIGNMDHALLMGMQWVDRLLSGDRESVWLDRI